MTVENNDQKLSADARVIQQDWDNVDNYLRRAMMEIASELGGDDYMKQIKQKLDDDSELLAVQTFGFLVQQYPEAGELVICRSEKIQEMQHKDDLIG